jgi:hypothetical protein
VDRDVATVPDTASHGSVAGRLRASYALPLSGQTALVLGPTVTVRPAELSVRFGTREAFGVPRVTLGAAVELRLGSL